MNGFKLSCLSCGKETIIIQDGRFSETDNQFISVAPISYDCEIGIECDCGNNVNV